MKNFFLVLCFVTFFVAISFAQDEEEPIVEEVQELDETSPEPISDNANNAASATTKGKSEYQKTKKVFIALISRKLLKFIKLFYL